MPRWTTLASVFTGIVEERVPVLLCENGVLILLFSPSLLEGLQQGASCSIDGVCLTVEKIEGPEVTFHLLEETRLKTTLGELPPPQEVNVERALKWEGEVGGHLLSGHIYGKGKVEAVKAHRLTLSPPPGTIKYFFSKGFAAVDGMSLTIVGVELEKNLFTLHLIPETLAKTTIGKKKPGALVNIEIDMQTLAIVDTVERVLERGHGR